MTPQSPNEALQPEAPPPPPPKPPSRRRPTLSALSGFLSLLVILAFVALGGLAYITTRLQEPGPLTADKVIFIAPHTELPEIVDRLESEGVIDSPFTLNAVLTTERKRGQVKAGEYLFKAHASLRAVVDTLVSGKQILHPITIPEGLTSAQIVQRLRDNDLLVGEIRVIPKEGDLLPETYKVARGMKRSDLINKMEEDQRRALDQIWARRSPELPLRSPYELLTLASIVEKETGKADERSRVAGVFINRLQKHMRLQSDPTIVYGLVAGQGTLGHSITRSELDKRTPYNTYQIDGLPPGPIDNPGRAALEAVANPSRTGDLYFVADGSGGHAFSGSIEEHNRNVQRWRQIERDAKDKVDIDKLSPNAVTPPGRNQRSDASDAATFGVLPTSVGTVSVGRVAAFMDPKARHDIEKVAAAEDVLPPTAARRGHKAKSVDMTAMATSLDSMGFSIQGVGASASDLLDGPISPAPGAPPSGASGAPVPGAPVLGAPVLGASVSGASGPGMPGQNTAGSTPPAGTSPNPALAYAASPQRVGQPPLPPRVRDAKAALDAIPGQQQGDLFADPNPPSAPVAPPKPPPEHPKIYDVSEGTALDPLKNKSFDLNSGKTIPSDFVGK